MILSLECALSVITVLTQQLSQCRAHPDFIIHICVLGTQVRVLVVLLDHIVMFQV